MKSYLKFPVVLIALSFAAICVQGGTIIQGSTIVWTNTSGGNWSDTNNWSPNQLPDSTAAAIITNSGNYTVILDVSASVSGLILGAGDSTTQTFLISSQIFSLSGLATVHSNGQFNLSGGTFDGVGGGAVFNGDLTCSSGTLTGIWTLATNSTMNLIGSIVFDSIYFTNYGTVSWNAGQLLGMSTPQFFNYGLWDAKANNELGSTTFNNYGTFRKSGGLGDGSGGNFSSLNGLNNSGMVDVESGTLDINGGVGGGTFNTAASCRTYMIQYTFTGDSAFTGDGTVDGTLTGSNGVLHGTINLNQSGLQGTLTIASNTVLNILANIGFSQTILTNYGTINWNAGQLLGLSSPQLFNYGLWDAKDNGQFNNSGGPTTFNNFGTFRKSGGTGNIYPYETFFDGQTTFNNSGKVDAQTGLLALGGSFSLTGGTLHCGINNSNDFGEISLPSNITLTGTLSVNFNNGFSPAVSNSFSVIFYGVNNGKFTGINLPHLLPGLAWQTSYGANYFTLNVVPAPPPPVITNQPVTHGVWAGGSSTFTVGVTGTGPFTYEWFFNSTNLPGGIETVAGDDIAGYSGDGGSATGASLDFPAGLSFDDSGNLFIADASNNVIRKLSTNGMITTVAGNGTMGYSGDGGPATNASLNFPQGVAAGKNGTFFIADSSNNVIRKVKQNGTITTVAGNGNKGYSGNGGPATNATLSVPTGVALDAAGNLFIADADNFVVREVKTNGNIKTVAGNGNKGDSGDGGAATNASLDTVNGLTLDVAGRIYISDWDSNVVRRVGTGGTITTVAGNGMAGYSGDGGPATNASLDHPFGLALDAAGNLYIADSFNNVIRQVKTNGIIVTVVGDGLTGYSGDGGAATNAALDKPESVAVNGSGNLFIADTSNDVVREVVPLLGRSLTLTNAGAAKAGYYQVVVTGPGGSVTSSVAQLIVSGKPLVYRSTVNTNKTFSLKLLSLPGSTNVVQRATNLVLHTVWQPISTNISAADGSWQFTDPKATNFSKSFYRFQTR